MNIPRKEEHYCGVRLGTQFSLQKQHAPRNSWLPQQSSHSVSAPNHLMFNSGFCNPMESHISFIMIPRQSPFVSSQQAPTGGGSQTLIVSQILHTSSVTEEGTKYPLIMLHCRRVDGVRHLGLPTISESPYWCNPKHPEHSLFSEGVPFSAVQAASSRTSIQPNGHGAQHLIGKSFPISHYSQLFDVVPFIASQVLQPSVIVVQNAASAKQHLCKGKTQTSSQ